MCNSHVPIDTAWNNRYIDIQIDDLTFEISMTKRSARDFNRSTFGTNISRKDELEKSKEDFRRIQ